MTTNFPDLLDAIDGLNERLRWAIAVAGLIAAYDDTDDLIRDGADSISRHLAEARRLVRGLSPERHEVEEEEDADGE